MPDDFGRYLGSGGLSARLGDPRKTQEFAEIQDQRLPFGISDLVYQEVLMGARNKSEWRTLDDYLATQRFYALIEPPHG